MCGLELGAVDAPAVDLGDDLLQSAKRGLPAAVRPKHARLPARKAGLVPEEEVEERAHVGLAEGQFDAFRELEGLCRQILGARSRRVGNRMIVVLRACIEWLVSSVGDGLVARLEIPDRNARRGGASAVCGNRLRRAPKSITERLEESIQITLSDVRGGEVLLPR